MIHLGSVFDLEHRCEARRGIEDGPLAIHCIVAIAYQQYHSYQAPTLFQLQLDLDHLDLGEEKLIEAIKDSFFKEDRPLINLGHIQSIHSSDKQLLLMQGPLVSFQFLIHISDQYSVEDGIPKALFSKGVLNLVKALELRLSFPRVSSHSSHKKSSQLDCEHPISATHVQTPLAKNTSCGKAKKAVEKITIPISQEDLQEELRLAVSYICH